ncbi:hypothetical protein MSPP1_001677 [Malassezia sp. CBS 17886]|nr:hypothetical protein MSPP1_001677 [Malassezia sp. CBS 17886]
MDAGSGTAAHDAWLARLALILSPDCQLPPPVKKPQNMHPLPDGVDEYFVYPFHAEDLVASPSTPVSSRAVAELAQRHAAVMDEHAAQKREKQRSFLQAVAPGWQPDQAPLQPRRAGPAPAAAGAPHAASLTAAEPAEGSLERLTHALQNGGLGGEREGGTGVQARDAT